MNRLPFIITILLFVIFYDLSIAQWHRDITTPGVKYDPFLVYDSERQVVVMVDERETWEWNGVGWSLVATTTPGAREGAAIAYDPQRKTVVLYGGQFRGHYLGDTWTWDGSKWNKVSNSGPSVRSGAVMAYDSSRGGIILFGGVNLSNANNRKVFDETWFWNGKGWELLKLNKSPPPREGAVMSYDEKRSTHVLFGGSQPPGTVQPLPKALFDTWELDAKGWHHVKSAELLSYFNLMFYDTSVKSVFLVDITSDGSRFYRWNGRKWIESSAVTDVFFGSSVAHHNASGLTVLYGGSPDTITWDGQKTTAHKVTWPIYASQQGALAYDAASGTMVLYNVDDNSYAPEYARTWQWNGYSFKLVSDEGPEGIRANAALAYHTGTKSVYRFGGMLSTIYSRNVTYYNDTWRWDGKGWRKVPAGGSIPLARINHSMACDEKRDVIVMFGGFYREGRDARFSPMIIHNDTWEFDGSVWTQVETNGPCPRYAHAMAYDASIQKVVLFGGITYTEDCGQITFGDTWTWDGSQWSELGSTGPSPRYGHSLVYDELQNRLLLFGGQSPSMTIGETDFQSDLWELKAGVWRKIRVNGPVARSFHLSSYNKRSGQMVIAGGNNSLDDLWHFGPHRRVISSSSDYDGDGHADPLVFNTRSAVWDFENGENRKFGKPGAMPFAGDFDGDGKAEQAYFIPDKGVWNIKGSKKVLGFGQPGDIPVPGDYDGDGRDEIVLYRPKTSEWIFRSGLELLVGKPGDIPVPGDYDGDGLSDICLYRASEGMWYFKDMQPIKFGNKNDIPVPADYNGDGKTDLALFRPTSGRWIIKGSKNIYLGSMGDMPVPADYNGNGRANVAVYRPGSGEWLLIGRKNIILGGPGKIPLN